MTLEELWGIELKAAVAATREKQATLVARFGEKKGTSEYFSALLEDELQFRVLQLQLEKLQYTMRGGV